MTTNLASLVTLTYVFIISIISRINIPFKWSEITKMDLSMLTILTSISKYPHYPVFVGGMSRSYCAHVPYAICSGAQWVTVIILMCALFLARTTFTQRRCKPFSTKFFLKIDFIGMKLFFQIRVILAWFSGEL